MCHMHGSKIIERVRSSLLSTSCGRPRKKRLATAKIIFIARTPNPYVGAAFRTCNVISCSTSHKLIFSELKIIWVPDLRFKIKVEREWYQEFRACVWVEVNVYADENKKPTVSGEFNLLLDRPTFILSIIVSHQIATSWAKPIQK